MKIDMARKSTDNLRSELMDTPDLTTFLAANEDNFSSASAVARLNEMLEKKGLSKAALAKQSGMSEIYLHQIFAGRRNPSRSRMLCLCFGLSASLEETQELLRLCGLAELYPKVRRDAIIIYGLLHGMDLFAVNDRLFSEDEKRCSDTYTLKSDTTRQKAPALKAGAFPYSLPPDVFFARSSARRSGGKSTKTRTVFDTQWMTSYGMPETHHENAICHPPMKKYGMAHSTPKHSPCSPAMAAQSARLSLLRNGSAASTTIGQT